MSARCAMRRGGALLAVWLLAWTACDAGAPGGMARVDPGISVDEGSALRRGAQLLITPRGLEGAWARRLQGGLSVDSSASTQDLIGVRFGPIIQTLPVTRFDSQARQELIDVGLTLNALQMTIPVRFEGDAGATVICRWQLSASSATIASELAVVENTEGYALRSIGEPIAQLSASRVAAIGSCPVKIEETLIANGLTRAQFDERLGEYAKEALARSAERLFATPPSELIGLLQGELIIEQAQRAGEGAGALRLQGQLSRDPDGASALTLSNEGLLAALDVAALSEAAACAPLREVSVTPAAPISAPRAEEVRQAGADMAVALSQPLVERIAQAMTRAGLLCLGVDRADGFTAQIATRDAELERLGIDASLFGESLHYALTPSALPGVTLDATRGVIALKLLDLQVDLYAQLFDTSAHVVRLDLDLDVALTPVTDQPGSMRLRLDAIKVAEASLSSAWSASTPPEARETIEFSERLMTLILRESLTLPLPLTIEATLKSASVRRDHLLLFVEF